MLVKYPYTVKHWNGKGDVKWESSWRLLTEQTQSWWMNSHAANLSARAIFAMAGLFHGCTNLPFLWEPDEIFHFAKTFTLIDIINCLKIV